MFNLHRGRIKRLSKHKFVHKDNRGTEFFIKLTDMFDISVLMYHPINNTYREFILDYAILRTLVQFTEGKPFSPHKGLINESLKHPNIVDDYVTAGFTIVRKVGDARMANSVTFARTFEFEKGAQSLVARRVIYTDKLVIGMDTIALHENTCKAIVNRAIKMFGKDNFDYIIKEEVINGTN